MTLSLLQLQYDQFPTGSQTAGVVVKGLFVADHCKRLLLTDFAAQLDVELAHYRAARETTVKLLLPQIDAALLVRDVDVLALLLLDVGELAKKLPARGVQTEEKSALDVRVCAEVDAVTCELSDRVRTLRFSAESCACSCCRRRRRRTRCCRCAACGVRWTTSCCSACSRCPTRACVCGWSASSEKAPSRGTASSSATCFCASFPAD